MGGVIVTDNNDAQIVINNVSTYIYNVAMQLEKVNDTSWVCQLFYSNAEGGFAEERSVSKWITEQEKIVIISVNQQCNDLRIDLGNQSDLRFELKNVVINPGIGIYVEAIVTTMFWVETVVLAVLTFGLINYIRKSRTERLRFQIAIESVICGFICAASLSANVVVADLTIAQQEYDSQLSVYDINSSPGSAPAVAVSLAKLWQILPDNSWTWSVTAIALSFLFYHIRKKGETLKFYYLSIVISAFFGIIHVLCLSIKELDDWSFVTANQFQFFLALFIMLGYALLFYYGIMAFNLLINDCRAMRISPPKSRIAELWDKKTHLFASVVILAGWLPWLIIYLPGSVSVDSAYQLEQAFGTVDMTAHHPVLSTWLQGGCMWLGRLLVSDNLGVFLYTALQSIFCVWVYGGIAAFAKKLGCCRGIQIGITAIFTLVPIWGAFAQVEIKDTLFTGMFTLFVLMTADMLLFSDEWKGKRAHWILYVVISLLTCLLRHNGVYAVIPGMVCTALALGRNKIRLQMLCASIVTIMAFMLFNWGSVNILGIPKGSTREMLSLPFQQTARYVVYYGNEVTGEEREAIDAVLNYDEIPDRYRAWTPDFIKESYKNPDTEALKEYAHVWLEMFLKHPDCYIQATMASTYGYYTAIQTDVWKNKEQYFCYMSNLLLDGGFDADYIVQNDALRYALYDWALTFEQLPLLGLLTSRGFCTWVLIGATLIMLQRERRKIVLVIPLFMIFLTCVASPVNDLLRYYLPILAAAPIYLCVTISAKNN